MNDSIRQDLSPAGDDARIRAEIEGASSGADPFAAAARATRMPMVITDPRQADNPVVFANDAFCQLTGYAREEIIGRNCRFLQGPQTDRAAVTRVREAVAKGCAIEIDLRNHRKDGTPFWNRLLMAPVHDDAGGVVYFFASQVDVTHEREQLEGLENANAGLVVEVAGRLRAQEEIEARLRFAARAGRMGIWELDIQSQALTTSSICRENFGRTAADSFTYADLEAAIHPEDRNQVMGAIQASLRDGSDCDIEYRVLRPDGIIAWLQLRAQVLRDGAGRPIRLAGISVDVTERRRAADELQRTTALLGAIIENATGLIYAKDRQGRMILANGATLGLIGKPWSEVRGKRDDEILEDPAQAAAVMENDRLIMASGTTQMLEENVATPDGKQRLWLSTKSPLREPTGEVAGIVGVSMDITERKRAEQALQSLNETLEQRVYERTRERDRTWNNSQDILLVAGAGGEIVAVNPAWTQILGWEASECIGRRCVDFVHPDDAAAVIAIAGDRTPVLPPLENRYRTSAGDYRWISWVGTREDKFTYASGRHVTAEKEAAAALARTEDALRQSQKMEAVGQLTGGIAHDFNNLLTGITGSLTLLTRRMAEGRTDGLERYTSAAISSAQRAAALTQRLLAFARRQPLDPRRVDANRLVAEMEDLVARTVGPQIEVRTMLASGLWPTLCDPNQLEGALLNLVINARDAMPSGGTLTIRTSNTELDQACANAKGFDVKPGEYVGIDVIDTGTGMTPEVIARAFEPFFTTKPVGQGTGLGLSMLYGFVRQSDGYVQIESVVGQGTTFRLYLPRDRNRSQDRMRDVMDTETGDMRAVDGETVLVVDDEAVVRMLVVETLEDLGYAAIQAGDGHAGLALLQSEARVDLLVTDVGLPGLNGRQLADAARKLRPGLPVLFITGYAHNAAVGQGEALEPGMEIITKPFSVDGLAFKIREMIETNAAAKPV